MDDSEAIVRVLDYLGRDLEPSFLIGGWATQMRVGGEISKDIDLIIGNAGLRQSLKEKLDDYSENRHHSGGLKIRGSVEGVHIDAYIPHESMLGTHLQLEVAELIRHIGPEQIRGWSLLSLEAHLVSKFAALLDRPDSEKGAKDAREIAALLSLPHSMPMAVQILISASKISNEGLVAELSRLFDLLPDRAQLNKSARRDIHQTKRIWLDELSRQLRRANQLK